MARGCLSAFSGWFLFLFVVVFGAEGATVLRVPGTLEKVLVSKGVSKRTVQAILRGTVKDVDVGIILKNVTHKESIANYKRFLGKKTILEARRFLERQRFLFAVIEKVYRVPREVIVAILMVETSLGRQEGKYPVVRVYASLASLVDKKIRKVIYPRAAGMGEDIHTSRFRKRMLRKAKWGLKELVCLLQLSEEGRIDLAHLKGSWAGAFGIPQFIPTSYRKFGVDWDVDGRVCLDQLPDAAASVANYLKMHGWDGKVDPPKALKIIKQYNHSHPYAKTILEMARRLRK